jgi:hypothetical protein
MRTRRWLTGLLPVTFDASGSSNPDGRIDRYEWSLDGLGITPSDTFEVDGETQPTIAHQIVATAPEARKIGLRVTDSSGATAEQVGTLRGVRSTGPRTLPAACARLR